MPCCRSNSATWCSARAVRAAAAAIDGCVEAYTSLPALAELLGVGEPELLQLGDDWVNAIPIPSRVRQELRRRLFRLGLAIGNTLNAKPSPGVVISGWPSLLAGDDRKALIDGIDACLLGGLKSAQALACFRAAFERQ